MGRKLSKLVAFQLTLAIVLSSLPGPSLQRMQAAKRRTGSLTNPLAPIASVDLGTLCQDRPIRPARTQADDSTSQQPIGPGGLGGDLQLGYRQSVRCR